MGDVACMKLLLGIVIGAGAVVLIEAVALWLMLKEHYEKDVHISD